MTCFRRKDNAVSKSVVTSLLSYSRSISLQTVYSVEKIENILQNELLQNPELFFVNGFKLMHRPMTTVVYPNYSYDESAYKATMDACRRKARQLVSRIQGTDDYSRVLQAHDFLARNVVYTNRADKNLHTIVGPLTNKTGVCEGYAKTFKYLLDMMSIPCLIVYGFGYDPGTGVEERHAWNLVQLGGKWTHIDVTFDTTIRSGHILRYDYFGLTNDQIFKDHRYEADKYPMADQVGYGYYERNSLVMETKKQMNDFVLNALRSGKEDCVFKLPDSSGGENLDIKVSSDIQALSIQLGMNLQYTMSYNIKQRVFHIHFEK